MWYRVVQDGHVSTQCAISVLIIHPVSHYFKFCIRRYIGNELSRCDRMQNRGKIYLDRQSLNDFIIESTYSFSSTRRRLKQVNE